MIVSLTIENFRCFATEQELSAVANTRQTNHDRHLVEVPEHGERLVPVLAIFGANGAGKSTIVNALGWLWHHVTRASPEPGESALRSRHMFLPPSQPTRLEVRFLQGDEVFSYSVSAGDLAFEGESLSRIRPSGAAREVFVRNQRGEVTLGKDVEASEKLRALRVLGARPRELFLAKAVSELSAHELAEPLATAHRWFAHLVVVQPSAPYVLLESRIREPDFNAFLGRLLKDLGTGVDRLRTIAEPLELSSLSPQQLEAFRRFPVGGKFGQDARGRLVKTGEETAEVHHVEATHTASNGKSASLPWEQESDGTQRLAELAPAAFEAGRVPLVFVIDELDRSLHASLVRAFVQRFLERARGHRNQLIFTTHETHVLDQELLRRDEVWFVEKRAQASEIYSLDDFEVRTDLRLDRGYLSGRFGAVPVIR